MIHNKYIYNKYSFPYLLTRAFSKEQIRRINKWITTVYLQEDSLAPSLRLRGVTGAEYVFYREEFEPRFLEERAEKLLAPPKRVRRRSDNNTPNTVNNAPNTTNNASNTNVIIPTQKFFTTFSHNIAKRRKFGSKQIARILRLLRDGEKLTFDDRYWLKPTLKCLFREYPNLDREKFFARIASSL